jgi:hypothetical protein
LLNFRIVSLQPKTNGAPYIQYIDPEAKFERNFDGTAAAEAISPENGTYLVVGVGLNENGFFPFLRKAKMMRK